MSSNSGTNNDAIIIFPWSSSDNYYHRCYPIVNGVVTFSYRNFIISITFASTNCRIYFDDMKLNTFLKQWIISICHGVCSRTIKKIYTSHFIWFVMNKNFIVCKIETKLNDENKNGESKQLKRTFFLSNKQLHDSGAYVCVSVSMCVCFLCGLTWINREKKTDAPRT